MPVHPDLRASQNFTLEVPPPLPPPFHLDLDPGQLVRLVVRYAAFCGVLRHGRAMLCDAGQETDATAATPADRFESPPLCVSLAPDGKPHQCERDETEWREGLSEASRTSTSPRAGSSALAPDPLPNNGKTNA